MTDSIQVSAAPAIVAHLGMHKLYKNAHVTVVKQFDEKHRPLAAITVNGELQHIFPHTSRVSQHLDVMDADSLARRLSGGSFFSVENQLVDFRDGSYKGFIHTDANIQMFMDLLGYQHKNELNLVHMQKDTDENDSPIVLRKIWDKNEIMVPGYASGGEFNSVLSFTWNPYVKTVNTVFDLVRLICTNGMVGLTNFVNSKVPLENRFEEHLNIAARLIQNKVNGIVVERVGQMAKEHCSVADLLLLESHATERLQTTVDSIEHAKLSNIIHAVSPSLQLADIYRPSVFEDKNLAAQLPGHLSAFDVFNVATEMRTHILPSTKSSDFALDKFANGKLFDSQDNYNVVAGRASAQQMDSFESSQQAFFGNMA
jgi:hypothetical protein